MGGNIQRNASFPNKTSSSEGINNRRGPQLSAQCIFSYKNNKIINCEMSKETPNENFSMNNYLSYFGIFSIETILKMKKIERIIAIAISADEDFSFPLYCHEESSIAAFIFFFSIFFFQ